MHGVIGVRVVFVLGVQRLITVARRVVFSRVPVSSARVVQGNSALISIVTMVDDRIVIRGSISMLSKLGQRAGDQQVGIAGFSGIWRKSFQNRFELRDHALGTMAFKERFCTLDAIARAGAFETLSHL